MITKFHLIVPVLNKNLYTAISQSIMQSMSLKILMISLFYFLAFNPEAVFSQELLSNCGSGLELLESDENLKRISVNISTSGAYTCELYEISSNGPVLKTSKNGSGNGPVNFESLNEAYYKVVVNFNGEQEKICQRLQVSGISLFNAR